MPDREYGGGSYNSGYGLGGGFNPRAGDTPGFGTGGGGSVGGGGGFGTTSAGTPAGGGGQDYQSQGRGSNVTDARPVAPAEAAMPVNMGLAMGQGRGSNVTSAFPFSPVDTMRYGMTPQVQQQVAPLSFPTFAQYQVSPYTVGMPSIMANVPPPTMQITPTTEAFRPTGYTIPDLGAQFGKYNFTPMMGQSSGPQRRGVPESAIRSNFEYTNRNVLNNFLDKTATTESSNDPYATNPKSSATGLYQFTKGTWLDTVAKNRPDLLHGRSEQEVLDMRFDPVLSTEMARNLAIDNARTLKANGIPVTEQNLYTSHFLGVDAAVKAIKSAPETPISSIVSDKAVRANPTILGQGQTVADVLGWTGSQMNRPAYASKSTPVKEAGTPFSGKTYTYDTMPKGPVLAGGSDQAVAEAATRAAQGGQQTAAQAASSSPQNFGDWLGSLFDTGARVKELEAQGRTSTYPTFGGNNPDADWTATDAKQWYADQYTGGDVSKVKSRIVDFGQGPVVDYYAKDLGEKIFGDIGQGIASLFGGKSEGSSDANLSNEEYFRKYGRNRGE